jgi:hypothetical protein
MCVLATRGHASAIAIVCDYLDYGECWDIAFEALANTQGDPISVDEVSRVINQRFPDDDHHAMVTGVLLSRPYTRRWPLTAQRPTVVRQTIYRIPL